jgi:hypothetical protein
MSRTAIYQDNIESNAAQIIVYTPNVACYRKYT